MKNINTKATVAIGLAGLLSLLWFGNWMQGAICLLLAGGFGLSTIKYTTGDQSTGSVRSLFSVRNCIATLAMLVAIALMGYDVGRDLKKATHRTSKATSYQGSKSAFLS